MQRSNESIAREGGRQPPERSRYITLDGMRGAAALAVALFHFQRSALPGGYLAVDFFFLLSGFVLERTYDARLGADFSFARLPAVWAMRLVPIHMIGVLLGAVMLAFEALRH